MWQPQRNLSFVKSNSKHQTQFSHRVKRSVEPTAPQIFHSVLFTHFFVFYYKTAKERKKRNSTVRVELRLLCQNTVFGMGEVRGLLAQLGSANAFSVFHSKSAKELKGGAQKAAKAAQHQSIFTLLFRAISSKLD